jgi:hypothetical protein
LVGWRWCIILRGKRRAVAKQWGPYYKKLADGNEMAIWSRFKITTGDTVWWAECTDGWTGKEHVDRNDAEHDHGQHFSKQHGGK